MTAAAKWATRPTPGARHELGQVSRVARLLGTPLMPWQAQVARVASELRPDGRGWRWPTVVITVPRQSGKTTLMRAVLAQRAMTRPNMLAFYTAQTGKDAKARWLDLVNAIEQVPIFAPTAGGERLIEKRLAAGDPGLTFKRTGSRISPFSPTPTSLHGYTPPLVMLDEGFAFSEDQGTDLMGAILPAQVTIPDRQLWIVSTAGNADSAWLRDWCDRGRAATADPASPIAYFDWSAPEGADLYAPETWVQYHPALGHTITAADLAEQSLTCPPGEWRRAYGNLWTTTRESVLDVTDWDQLAGALAPPTADQPIGLAYDVHHDRSHSSVWTAWLDADDRAQLRLVKSAPGMEWVAAAVREARAELGHRARVAAHDDGPTRHITDQLTAEGVAVAKVGGRDYATACGQLLRRAKTAQLVHDGSPNLRAAWEDAAHRPTGEAWAFTRHLSAGPIDALIAALLAVRIVEHAPTEEKPQIYTGRAA